MAADYYRATTENGDQVDDPSEDGLWELLTDLIALNKGEHIAARAVRAEIPRSTVEAHRLQAREHGPDQR